MIEEKVLLEQPYHIFCADCTDADLFSTPFIDVTVTSPPYNLDMGYNSNDDNLQYKHYLEFTHKWLQNVYQWTNPTGRLCLNIPLDTNKGGQQSIGSDITQIAKQVGWQYHTTIIWNEQNISRRTAWGSWLSASAPYVIAPVELIIVFYKGVWKKSYKGTSDIQKQEFLDWTNGLWTFNGESAKRIGHPAPYPVELPYRCIKMFSYQQDTIFDPFLGSGTTLIAAKQLARNGIGVELDEQYYNLAKNRINRVLL